jgi:hypothetical protein
MAIRTLGRALSGALLLAAVGAPGCGLAPMTRAEFNEMIADQTRELATTANTLRNSLEPLDRGEPLSETDLAKAQTAHGKIPGLLSRARSRVEGAVLPPAKTAPELRDKFLAWLKIEEDSSRKKLDDIMSIAQKNDIPPKDRWAQIDALAKQIDADEKPALTDLEDAQKKYADENRYKLVQKYKDADAK